MGERGSASGHKQLPFQKKPYEKPSLQTFGTLTELTQSVGSAGMSESGGRVKTR